MGNLLNSNPSKYIDISWNIIFIARPWEIWKIQNDFVFNKRAAPAYTIVRKVVSMGGSIMEAFNLIKEPSSKDQSLLLNAPLPPLQVSSNLIQMAAVKAIQG